MANGAHAALFGRALRSGKRITTADEARPAGDK
jgi:hypothetical protein